MPAVAALLGLSPLRWSASFNWSTSACAAAIGITSRFTTTRCMGQVGSEWSHRADSKVTATVPAPIDKPQHPDVKTSGACGSLIRGAGWGGPTWGPALGRATWEEAELR